MSKRALVVGINRYDNFKNLTCCEDDAKAMIACRKWAASKSASPAAGPAKTTTFLTHWVGLSSRTRSPAVKDDRSVRWGSLCIDDEEYRRIQAADSTPSPPRLGAAESPGSCAAKASL